MLAQASAANADETSHSEQLDAAQEAEENTDVQSELHQQQLAAKEPAALAENVEAQVSLHMLFGSSLCRKL